MTFWQTIDKYGRNNEFFLNPHNTHFGRPNNTLKNVNKTDLALFNVTLFYFDNLLYEHKSPNIILPQHNNNKEESALLSI